MPSPSCHSADRGPSTRPVHYLKEGSLRFMAFPSLCSVTAAVMVGSVEARMEPGTEYLARRSRRVVWLYEAGSPK